MKTNDHFLGAAAIAFGLGVTSSAAYLLLGGECIFGIPHWASIVFYPGFFAGVKAYEACPSVALAEVLGVATVGAAYAIIAVLAHVLWRFIIPKD